MNDGEVKKDEKEVNKNVVNKDEKKVNKEDGIEEDVNQAEEVNKEKELANKNEEEMKQPRGDGAMEKKKK